MQELWRKEKLNIPPQIYVDPNSFLWWSSSLIEPPESHKIQIWFEQKSVLNLDMAAPGEGGAAGGGGVGKGAGGPRGGGPGARDDPRPIPYHHYAQLNIKQPMCNWDGNQDDS